MLIRCIVLLFIWSASAQDLEQEFAEKGNRFQGGWGSTRIDNG